METGMSKLAHVLSIETMTLSASSFIMPQLVLTILIRFSPATLSLTPLNTNGTGSITIGVDPNFIAESAVLTGAYSLNENLDVNWAYGLNADTFIEMKIPKQWWQGDREYDYSFVHPYWIWLPFEFPDNDSGTQFLCVATPFPVGFMEDPCLRMSRDGDNWAPYVSPDGDSCPDPVILQDSCRYSGLTLSHGSDGYMTFEDVSKTLYVFNRVVYTQKTSILWERHSTDLISWNSPDSIFKADIKHDFLSPCFLKMAEDSWRMYYVYSNDTNDNKNSVRFRTKSGLTGWWGTTVDANDTTVTLNGLPSGPYHEPWHLEIRWNPLNPGQMIMSLTMKTSGAEATGFGAFLLVSNDLGKSFSCEDKNKNGGEIIRDAETSTAWDADHIYKFSTIWQQYNGVLYGDVLYSGYRSSATYHYHIGHTFITLDEPDFVTLNLREGFARAREANISLYPGKLAISDSSRIRYETWKVAGDITANDRDTFVVSADIPGKQIIDRINITSFISSGSSVPTIEFLRPDMNGEDQDMLDSVYETFSPTISGGTLFAPDKDSLMLTRPILTPETGGTYGCLVITDFDSDNDTCALTISIRTRKCEPCRDYTW